MKLTKEKVQFIENYLIKNEVKYWDVRLELLDHIVTAVEIKIGEGISFNEALFDVHQGFGNSTKIYGIYNHKLMISGLYADNKGFNKFTKQKQKELGRNYRLKIGRALKAMFTSLAFLLEYALLIVFMYTLYNYSNKFIGAYGLVILILPYLYTVVYNYKDKSTRKSLAVSIVTNSTFLIFSLYNVGFQMFNMLNSYITQKPYVVFLIATCVLYPFVRAQLNVFLKVCKDNKTVYNLKFS